ncbi:hypothetical protein [Oceanobacillus jeddahense]|uniref:Uncharacterized protein n=1 Tax=Oceanobacillus jeddahense TaxID=1462527 RepID=A0ABY5JU51_9BACI|nr:hypothetical protein [Oceanobacillus jeddahense]UUI03875.1 hypothetical protein NP439_04055 [Oceanobacillus jeddahense]
MKTILLSTAAGALLFTGIYANTGEAEEITTDNEAVAMEETGTNAQEEMEVIQNEIPSENDSVQVVEDNPHKRILFIGDDANQKKYKTIFIKDTNRLKIIDLNGGPIFNDII